MSFRSKTIFFILQLLCLKFSAQQWYPVPNNSHNYYPVSLGTYNNKLFAGGDFTQIGGSSATRVAGYGGNWIAMQSGANGGYPEAFAVYNGRLYAAGFFTNMASVPLSNSIACWDGSQWFGAGNFTYTGHVYSLCVYNGELYAGGNFTQMGGVPCNRIAKWNGTSWSAVGGGVTGGISRVEAMTVYNGKLYVGGSFNWAGGNPAWYIASWNGIQWDSVGNGMNGPVEALITDTINNCLYAAGGYSQAGTLTSLGISKWDGVNWTPVGNGLDTLWGTKVLGLYNNELYGGGGNYTVTQYGDTLRNFYKFNGSKWISAGDLNGSLEAIQVFSGNLYIAGSFTQIDTSAIRYIACMGPNCLTVGLEDPEIKTGKVNPVFPNPGSEKIYIPCLLPANCGGWIKIYDTTGKLKAKVLAGEGKQSAEIDVSDWNQGLYFYVLEVDGVDVERGKMSVVR